MISEYERQYFVGAYISNDIDYQSEYVKSLVKLTKCEEFSLCLYNYNSADKNVAETMKKRMLLEKQLNNISVNTIYNESTNLLNGDITTASIGLIQSSLDNLYRPTIKALSISELQALTQPRNKFLINSTYLNTLMGTVQGIDEGRLYIFASKGKGGKSIVLQNLAQRLQDSSPNSKILYLSLENDADDIIKRGTEMALFYVDKDSHRIHNDYDVIYNPKATLSDISEYSKDYDIIIIDYLARIVPEKKYETTYEQYGDYTDYLHYLASDNNKIIITAAQLSRNALSVMRNASDNWEEQFKSIDQDSMADSMNIIRNADMVIITMKHEDKQYFHTIASRTRTDIDGCYLMYNIKWPLQLMDRGGII